MLSPSIPLLPMHACSHAQIAEVDKLNAIINLTEKDMLKLRKQYEVRIHMTDIRQTY